MDTEMQVAVTITSLCAYLTELVTNEGGEIFVTSSCVACNTVHRENYLTRKVEEIYTPFYCEEAVFCCMALPHIFQVFATNQAVDTALMKHITRTIIELATGGSELPLCRDVSYDLLFNDVALLEGYVK